MTNECPAKDCKAQKPREMAFCRRHWYRLPHSLRNRVWAGYRGDAGANWGAAMQESVAYIEASERVKSNAAARN